MRDFIRETLYPFIRSINLVKILLIIIVLISFNYVWINRIEVIKYDDLHYILLNKWTGEQCLFIGEYDYLDKKPRYRYHSSVLSYCKVRKTKDGYNKVIVP